MKWGGMSTHHLVNVHRSTVFNTLAVVNRNKRLRASETCSQSVLDHNVVWLSHHNTDFSKFANTVSRSFPDGGADGGGRSNWTHARSTSWKILMTPLSPEPRPCPESVSQLLALVTEACFVRIRILVKHKSD